MKLSNLQMTSFVEQGYVFCPGLLDDAEVTVLQSAMSEILNRKGAEVISEKGDPSAIRLAFGVHQYSEPFLRLSLLPRLLMPICQLLRDNVYLHQSRLNPKQGFGAGAAWDWHQDYPPWHQIDGMPEPRCIMASVFIDDCTAVTSPLLVIPNSHRSGLLEAQLHGDAAGRGYALHNISRATFRRFADESGIEALTGPAGSVAFVHCNLIHGSSNNVSPWRRAILYLIYNAVSNACTGAERPWYQNNRNHAPLQPLDDRSLRVLA